MPSRCHCTLQCHLDGIILNRAIYQKVPSSLPELGYKRTSQPVLSLSDLRGFLHENARTRATTKPTLPVESFLLKGCVLSHEQMTQLVHCQNDPTSWCRHDRNELMVHSMLISHLDQGIRLMWIQSGSSTHRL